MVWADLPRCHDTGRIRIPALASLTTFLLLSINTINCIAAQSINGSNTSSYVSVHITSNESKGLHSTTTIHINETDFSSTIIARSSSVENGDVSSYLGTSTSPIFETTSTILSKLATAVKTSATATRYSIIPVSTKVISSAIDGVPLTTSNTPLTPKETSVPTLSNKSTFSFVKATSMTRHRSTTISSLMGNATSRNHSTVSPTSRYRNSTIASNAKTISLTTTLMSSNTSVGTSNSTMTTQLITTTHHSFLSLNVTPTSTFLPVTQPMSPTLTDGNGAIPLTANITATPIRKLSTSPTMTGFTLSYYTNINVTSTFQQGAQSTSPILPYSSNLTISSSASTNSLPLSHSNIQLEQTISSTTFSMSSVKFNSSSNQVMNSSKNVFLSQTTTTSEKPFSTTTEVSSVLSFTLISMRNNSKRITTPNTTFIVPTIINKLPNTSVVLLKTATIYSTSLTASNPTLKTSSMTDILQNRPNFNATSISSKSIKSMILPKTTVSHPSNTSATTTSNTWTNKSHNISLPTPSKLISSYLNNTGTKNLATKFLATMPSTYSNSTQSSKNKMNFSSPDHSSTTVRSLSFVNSASSNRLLKSLTLLPSNTATAAVSNTTISSLNLTVTVTASSATTMTVSNSSVVSSKTFTVHNTSTVLIASVKTSSMITPRHSRPNFTATFASNKFITSTVLPKTKASFPSSISATPTTNPWTNKTAHNTTLPAPSVLISDYSSNTGTENMPTVFLTTMTGSALSGISNTTETLIRELSTSLITPNTTDSTWYTSLTLSTMITVTPSNYNNITATATNSTFTPPKGTSSAFRNSPKSSNIEKNVSSLNSHSSITIRKTISLTKTIVVNLTSTNNFTATSILPETFSTIYNHLISSTTFNSSLTAVMNSSTVVLVSNTTTATVYNTSLSSLRMTATVSSIPNFTLTSMRDNSTRMVTHNSTFISPTPVTIQQNTVLPNSSNFTPTQYTFSKTASMSTSTMMASNSSAVSSKTLTVHSTSTTMSNAFVKVPSMTTSPHSLPSLTATLANNKSTTTRIRMFSTFVITPNTTIRLTDSLPSTMIALTASSYTSISVMPTNSFLATTKPNITSFTYMNSPMPSNTMMNSSSLNYANSTVEKTKVTSAAETNTSVAFSTYILTSSTSSNSTALYVTSTTERKAINSQTVKSLVSSTILLNSSTPSASRTSNTQLLNSSMTIVRQSSSAKIQTFNTSVVARTLPIPSPTLSTILLTMAVSSTTLSVTANESSVASLKHFSPNSYLVTSSESFTDSFKRPSVASASNITLSGEYIPSTTISQLLLEIPTTSVRLSSSVLAVTTKGSSIFRSQYSTELIASTAISQSKGKFMSSILLSTVSTNLSRVERSSSPLYTAASSGNFGSSATSSAKLLPSTPQSYMDRKSSSDMLSTSPILTFTSMKSSEIKTIASTKSLTSASSILNSIPLSTNVSETELSRFSASFSKIPSLSKTVSSTGSIVSSTTSHNDISRSAKRFTTQLSSTSMIIPGSTKLSRVPSSIHSIVPSSSVSSFAPYSNTSVTATFPYVPPSSSSTEYVGEEFRVQVILLIPLNTILGNTFKETLRRKLENLYELGSTKTSSRKRRGINEMIFPLSHSGRNSNLINKDLHTSKGDGNKRFRRQTKNETRVEIINITRIAREKKVKVTFYVTKGGESVPAKEAAKILNKPSKADMKKILGFEVEGGFSPVVSQKKTENEKNETVLIVLAVCVPVVFVFGACVFIKCKKKQNSRKIKLNKVSIEEPREKANVAESAYEERYTRVPTLPMKDYPDVIIQTPERRKQRVKKAKLPKAPKNERENLPTAAPAAAFENITRMSFDRPSNVAIDGIPLRLRPAVRQEIEPKKPENMDIVQGSGTPRSLIESKNSVDMKSDKDDIKNEDKMATDTSKSVAGGDDADTDDTIQIKANIEKWRNKMRLREKRKEQREERKRATQEKLIALEEKKLSRRDWLMAQSEIQAILDGDDLSKPVSRKKKYRRERRPESRKYPNSDSDDEVMVVPVRQQHRRRWPQRSARRIYPSERDGVRLIAVRPKKPRVHAFEELSHGEFEDRYIPAQESSVPLQRPSGPVIAEAVQFREDYGYSSDSVYDEEFYDPYVPEYGESGHYQPSRTEYVTQDPMTLEQQLPLRMAETSFVGTPQRPEREHRRIGHRKAPRGMYFEQSPRSSSLYSRSRKSPNHTTPQETRDASSNDVLQRPVPSGQNTTPQPTTDKAQTPSPEKSLDISNKSDTSLSKSWDAKTNEDFLNYSICENEARKLVSRVLDRAKREADQR